MSKENYCRKNIKLYLIFLLMLLITLACNLPSSLLDNDAFVCEEAGGKWVIDGKKGKCIFDSSNEAEISPNQSDQHLIPAGNYTGGSNFYSTLENDGDDSYLAPICTENTVKVIIESDGTAHGEIRSICYSEQDTDKEDMRMTHHSEVIGVIQGELLENAGELSIAYTWRSYITSPQWDTPGIDNTADFVFPYHVKITESVMTFTPAADVEDYYSFTLHKE